jgi:hypothetical protein
MSKVFLSFEAESVDELLALVLAYASGGKTPPSWLNAPLDAEARQAEAEARARLAEADAEADDEDEDGNGNDNNNGDAPAPTPAPARKKGRPPRVSAAPAPAPPATPEASKPPAREIPALDTLKAAVTAAVRLAQKGEGSKKILELLPDFKDATGLAFIMNSAEEHRGALYDLVLAAEIPVI